jgi:hypothetical protein
LGAGRQALEYFSKSVALFDPMFLAHGGFQKGGTGSEELLQPYAAIFTSLPAVRFTTLSQDDNTVFREGQAEGSRWYYLVNSSGYEQTVDVSFPVAGQLRSLGLAPEIVDIEAGRTITITLPAYDLRGWKLTPAAE